MSLIRYNRPFGFPAFGRFFEDISDNYEGANKTFVPSVDIAENDKGYEIALSVPGVKKSDISVDVKDKVLTVSGERQFEEKKTDKNYYRVETSYGSFKRAFELPEDVKADKIDAQYVDGILKLHVPKEPKAELVKKIDVK